MNLSLILFLIGILGFVLNRKNIILMLISLEIMLLAITFLILLSSLSFDDILGQTYAIYIIAVAGAESAIGLAILVAFYRLYSSLNTACLSLSLKTYLKNKINSYSHYPSSIYFSNLSFITKSNKGINKIRTRSNSTKAFNEKVNTSVLGIKGSTLVP
jgi:NADH-ubiquinone oxidoreductase chain 4L